MRAEQQRDGGGLVVAIGEGQQQRHRDDAAEPGQDADHEAVDDADDHEQGSLRRQQGEETGPDGVDQMHDFLRERGLLSLPLFSAALLHVSRSSSTA